MLPGDPRRSEHLRSSGKAAGTMPVLLQLLGRIDDPEDRRQIALGIHLGEDPDDLRLSSHTDHLYVLGGSMRRSGSSPAYYQKLADEIREIRSENNYLENLWQEIIDLFIEEHEQLIQSKLESDIYKTDSRGTLISEDQRRAFFNDLHGNKIGDVAYATLSKLMPTHCTNATEILEEIREIPDYEERRQTLETLIAKAKKDPHRYVNGLYFLLSLVFAIHAGLFAAVPFLLLFLFGFFYVGGLSLWQRAG